MNKKHFLHWVLILMLMLTAVLTVQSGYLKVSVLETPEHAAFDGTVSPIQRVPNWTYTDYDEQQNDYSYFLENGKLIDIPEYNPAVLTESTDDLVWGSDEYEFIVNTQITYPVPYAGNYELDGEEYAGSHPAIDIKAPVNTPVYSMANGVVTETSESSSGFGNYVLITHHNVPSPDNPNYTTTLYSSYSHLNAVLVAEGDVVTKGQMIGKVGDTGTATTNHLHFQLDNDDAPWHPYWPFSYSDYSSLGYSFWEAVNEKVGYSNLIAYTEHPLEYVMEYQDFDAEFIDYEEIVASDTTDSSVYTYTSSGDDENEEDVVDTADEDTILAEDDSVDEVEDVAIVNVVERDFESIDLVGEPYVLLNNNLSLYVYLEDKDGNRISNPMYSGSLEVSLSDSEVGSINVQSLEKDDFDNGSYTIVFSAEAEGTTTLHFVLGDYEYTTEVSVIDEVKYVNGFEIVHDGSFVVGIPETVTIRAIDEDGEFTPSYNVSGKVDMTFVSGEGEFDDDELSKSDFVNGEAEVTFTATSADDVVIKAKNGAVNGMSTVIENYLFSDVETTTQYYKAIKFLRESDVIGGYPDGSFKASNSVSRVEALKMIFEALDTELSDGAKLTFSDVDTTQWYADYVATAKKLGIVDGYPDGTFRPSDPVNKVELIKMLLNSAGEPADPVVIGNPYEDVDSLDWFAQYANTAQQLNLTPVNGSYFEPDHNMTRGEVAETIYRWLAIDYNGADEYSVLLNMD